MKNIERGESGVQAKALTGTNSGHCGMELVPTWDAKRKWSLKIP